MPDVIHPGERAQIDARVAAGLYTVCPAGARSGVDWDEGDPVPLREQIRRQATAGKGEAARNSRRREEMEARRKRVATLYLAGVAPEEIVARSGAAAKTVERDIYVLRQAGRI